MPKYRQDELEQIHREYKTGRELVDAGMLEDAIRHFDSILGLLPRRRRDRIYRFEGALPRRRSDRILWLPTVFRDALLAKVYCLNELGRFTDAYRLLERAMELDPENPQVYAEIGYAHGAQDNLDMARAAYKRAADLEPHNPAHLRAMTHIALLAEDYQEAHALAQRALEIEADSITSLHQLAYAKYRLGNIDGAIRALEHAAELDPTDRESALRLAGTLREAGQVRKAISRLETYLHYSDTDPEALGMMTDLLQQDGTAPELFPHAERLLSRNPHDPHALDLLAWGYYQRGQVREALDVLRRLVRQEPMQPQHHFKLGMIYETLGYLPMAMVSLLRARALDDESEVGQMAVDAVSNLDQVQFEQILARADADLHFRLQLQQEPEQTLLQSGYLLSPAGFQMLQSIDFGREHGVLFDTRPRTLH